MQPDTFRSKNEYQGQTLHSYTIYCKSHAISQRWFLLQFKSLHTKEFRNTYFSDLSSEFVCLPVCDGVLRYGWRLCLHFQMHFGTPFGTYFAVFRHFLGHSIIFQQITTSNAMTLIFHITVNSIFSCLSLFDAMQIEFAEYNQQDAPFHNLFISVRRSVFFRRVFRPSSGAQNCTYSVRYLSD